jgi:hypothetical protein
MPNWQSGVYPVRQEFASGRLLLRESSSEDSENAFDLPREFDRIRRRRISGRCCSAACVVFFFFDVMPRRSRNSQTVKGATRTSRSAARRSTISASVMPGASSMQPRMKASGASSFERHGWPCLRAFISPVIAAIQAPAVEIPIEKRRAASRVEPPCSIAAITRPRRSPLRLLVIFTSGQSTSSSESDKADCVNPQTDSAFIEDVRTPTSNSRLLVVRWPLRNSISVCKVSNKLLKNNTQKSNWFADKSFSIMFSHQTTNLGVRSSNLFGRAILFSHLYNAPKSLNGKVKFAVLNASFRAYCRRSANMSLSTARAHRSILNPIESKGERQRGSRIE